jgi:glycosyltransferase involved in cell wall biosynthesis
MDYRPNVDAVVWFVDECWPEILEVWPLARFRVVGHSPSRAIRRLAHVPGVEIVGSVPSVQSELASFDVSVAPLRIAHGLQNKVLEAMAAGVPVVASSKAAAGVGGRHNEQFLIADGAESVIRSVLALASDPAERQRLGLAGRAFVARRHRWADALARFELCVTGAVQREAMRRDLVLPRAGRETAAPAPADASVAVQ